MCCDCSELTAYCKRCGIGELEFVEKGCPMPRGANPRKLDEADIAKIVKLRATLSTAQIAERFGVVPNTILKVIQDVAIQRRAPASLGVSGHAAGDGEERREAGRDPH